jgi:hypothetical protein
VLKGSIKLPMASKEIIKLTGKEKVKFRANIEQKTEKYVEKDIDKIVFNNGSLYRFIPISKRKKSLCKLIQKGKVTLYSRKASYAKSTPMYSGTGGNGTIANSYSGMGYIDEYFAFKKDDKIAFPIVTYGIGSSFKQKAIAYFSDCPSIVSKIENKTYKRINIIELVTKYNQCI